jgi:hypothetical protein
MISNKQIEPPPLASLYLASLDCSLNALFIPKPKLCIVTQVREEAFGNIQ